MNEAAGDDEELRVLLLAPTKRDAVAGERLLRVAGIKCLACRTIEEVCRQIPLGVGAVVVPSEALFNHQRTQFAESLSDQPAWSDVPVIVLAAAGQTSERLTQYLLDFGGVTLIKRPLEAAVFVAAVKAALRDRRRQYEVRAHLAEHALQAAALRDADRRKDEFLAMLGHELRNPLAPIWIGLEILGRSDTSPSMAVDVREIIERQIQHLARLVDDLLDVSRITRGKIELRKIPLDLRDVVRRAVETVQPLIDARQHELSISQPDRSVMVAADPTRMIQVVGNLLNNAAKYSESRSRISLALECNADIATITVKDSGLGISPTMLPLVFDLFTQLDRTLDRSQGGLGIGLTLVRSLVELHGGKVAASSDGPGKGSEFVVSLPLLAQHEIEPSQAGARVATAEIERRRILVVDDNADAAASLSMLLTLMGHDVRTVNDGLEVLAATRRMRPEVILLDIGLPGVDGYECARRIRAENFGRQVLLVAVTGYGQEEDRLRTKEAGFDHHLTKPADPALLKRLLADLRPSPAEAAQLASD